MVAGSASRPIFVLINGNKETVFAFESEAKALGCRLITVGSSEDALIHFKENEIAAAFVDLQTPFTAGFEAMDRLRSQLGTRAIPIVSVLPNDARTEIIDRALELGTADFLNTPIHPKLLRAKLKILTELHFAKQRPTAVAQTEASAADARYQDLIQGVDHAVIWSADPERLNFSFISPRAELVTGHSLQEWNEPDFFFGHVPPEDQQAIRDLISDALAGKDRGIEHRFVHKDGHLLWLHTGIRKAELGSGKGYEVRGLSTDVTQLVEAREQLKKSEENFRTLANAMPQIIWTATPDGFVDWYNDWWYNYLQLPRGARWDDEATFPMHPDDAERTKVLWPKAYSEGKPFEMEQRFRRGSDGMYRWHLVRGVPVRDESGRIVRYVGANTDIHDQKLLLEQVDENRRTLDLMIRTSPSFMCLIRGPNYVFEQVNEKYLQLVGHRNVVGKPAFEALPEVRDQGFIELLDEVRNTGRPFIGNELSILLQRTPDSDPERRFVDFVYQPAEIVNGKVESIFAHGVDVTEKVLARNAVENERRNFERLFSQTPQFVAILSGPDHRFEFVNESHVAMLGFNATGQTVKEAQPESVEVHDLLDEVYRNGETFRFSEIPITLGDRLRYFDVTYAPRRDQGERIDGIMVLGVEATGRVDTRKAIEESRNEAVRLLAELETKTAQLQAIIDTIPMSVIFAEAPTGRLLYSNQQFERVWRFPFKASPNVDAYGDYVGYHADGRRYQNSEWPLAQTLLTGKTISEDVDVLVGDQSRAIINITSAPVNNSKGETIAAVVISEDVTERRRAEANLRNAKDEAERAREELHSFFMQAPAPMVIFNGPEHHITLVNPLYEEYVGRKVLGKKLMEAFTDEEAGYYASILDRVYRTGEPYVGRDLPLTLRDSSGHARHRRIDVSYTPLNDGAQNIRGILVFIQDVTEQYMARVQMETHNRELQAAKEEAERANELKSAFLANMSHEIRTPLGAMIGFADLLREPGLSAVERSNYIDILSRNGESLSVIINDILDLSKVEAGHLTLEFTDAYPAQIAEDVLSLLRVKAKQKDLALVYEFDGSTPKTIVADPTRIRQVLLNIVGNAIKFTQYGSVTIRSFGCKSESGRDSVCYEVVDTGIGIPENQKERVFEMFVQADGTTSRRFGGTGLGLALSRSLARSMGGDISITKSEEGKGSTFLITIEDQPDKRNVEPRTSVEERKPLTPGSEKCLKGLKILVVDDSPDNRQLIWHHLNKQGAVLDTAEDGFVGLRMALAGNYDIILMDLQMPEMDGYTAIHKLRTAGYAKPVIALTAHAMNEVRDKVIRVGANAHLPKPINFRELIATISDQVH